MYIVNFKTRGLELNTETTKLQPILECVCENWNMLKYKLQNYSPFLNVYSEFENLWQ